jgi:predicted transcriptional regulator
MTHTAIPLRVDAALKERLQHLATAVGKTTSGLMREAIELHVDRLEKREALKREVQQRWDDYQTTGMCLTHEEVKDWFEKLKAGQDAELPPCHR